MKTSIVKATKADHSTPSRRLVLAPGQNPDWDTLFDGKFVLAYAGTPERIEILKEEFERVGLHDVEIAWNADDKFAQEYFDANSWREEYAAATMGQFRFFNNALGHYRIIKGAYQRGFEHILVMEDDIKFMHDTDLLQRILAEIPADYEVAMLDSHGVTEPREGPYWRIVKKQRTSAGCYALSRDGMAKMIAIYENKPYQNSDSGFILDYFNKPYFCYPLIARQVPGGWWRDIYTSDGIDAKDYGK